jgi:hypothetical protein
MSSSGMLCRVALVRTDDFEESTISNIRLIIIGELRIKLAQSISVQRASVASYF